MYNFDEPIDRRATNSLKWDVGADELPMWVADMDFRTAPEIVETLEKRAAHGVFGYNIIPDEWYGTYINWWQSRHNLTIKPDELIFTTGVVPAISTAVRKLTTPAERVLVQTPVYNIFFNSILNNGRVVSENPLSCVDGEYSVDFADLEEKLSDPQVSLMILCNPQNPAGKIWDKETLSRIAELCACYNVTVIADEIHCDLTDPGKAYVPFASVSETARSISVTCLSPTKAFNIAGLQTAAVMVPNPNLRHKMWRALNTDEVAEPNSFAIDAAVAAFTKGGAWLDELRAYLYENKKYAAEYIAREIPSVTLIKSDATYLLWIDCTKIPASDLQNAIRRETGLYLSEGAIYGTGLDGFLRMNIACPRALLKDGLNRLKRGVEFIERNV